MIRSRFGAGGRKGLPHRIPAAELDIMCSIWRRGSATTREVHDDLVAAWRHAQLSHDQHAHSAVGNQRVSRRRPVGNAFIYFPAIAQETVAAKRVKGKFFDGSAAKLVAHLLKSYSLSDDEKEAVKAMVAMWRAK